MAQGPDASFVEKWNKEAHLVFEQQKSKLFDHVKITRDTGKTYNFPVFDNEEALEGKERHADVTITSQNSSNIPVTANPIYIAYVVDDWDQAQSDVNYRELMNRKAAGAIWRKFDDVIIAALNANTNSEITMPSANTFNYAGAELLASTLDLNEVDMNNRYGVISPGAQTDLRNDTTYINNFHFNNDVVEKGVLKDVAGIDYTMSTRLPNGGAGATERRVFAFHPTALGVYVSQDFRITVDWDARKQGYLYVASMMVGSAIIDQKGIQFADITN